ncbi:MAG TPA: hypothetical protein VFV67_25585 [Actinophytocola sp.]|uniref:hypothetical protein n=1 Tax=Actinophytocola sp. TaxID=1872138 RepID=UPI002DB8C74C|nr:hypothetical protein [Actinophytocola sp.]HEU5474032.1 hypothetical protein [Actinophytocola sp.]
MFSTTVTRPLVWSFPLAVLGVIGAGVFFFRPVTEDFTGTEVLCDGEYFYSFDPSEGCSAAITRHVVLTVIILVGTVLPLLVVAVRACVLSADGIFTANQELDRMRDRINGLHRKVDRLERESGGTT